MRRYARIGNFQRGRAKMELDRRQAKRLTMPVPMLVRGKRRPLLGQGVESMNISIRGTYFVAEGPFRVGEKIHVRLTMPEAVVPRQKTEWCLTGRVEHVNRLVTCGRVGVGVHFLCYTAEQSADRGHARGGLAPRRPLRRCCQNRDD